MNKNNKNLKIGYHTNYNNYFEGSPVFDGPAKTGRGVDFLLCHVDPIHNDFDAECDKAREAAAAIAELGLSYIANFEEQNWSFSGLSPDGMEWCRREDGSFRLNVPQKYFEALSSAGNFDGIMFDEFEHCIINNNASVRIASHFKTDQKLFKPLGVPSLLAEGENLDSQLASYNSEMISKGGVELSGEHVFPVLFHTFARNGIVPNFKCQKESCSNLQFAVAGGAALEYDTPLYSCVDLWYRNTFPGHSPEELYSNLMFTYYAGVNKVYPESAEVFYDKKPDGSFEYNAYGKAFTAFADRYKGLDRGFDISDYRPEIGIIRYDDSWWGQGRSGKLWKNTLLGCDHIKPVDESKEYVRCLNIVTHGKTGNRGVCWDAFELRSLRKHRSFFPMNSLAVFDDRVTEEKLASLKLCFLCGVRISPETMAAVSRLVKERGLTVVTPFRYLPDRFKTKNTIAIKTFYDGSGRWIAADDFRNPLLKSLLKPYLGNKDEIRLTFRNREIILAISEDGDRISVIKDASYGGNE